MPFVDHASLGVPDLAAGARFYGPVLRALGARRFYQDAHFVGYGSGPANGTFFIHGVGRGHRPAATQVTPLVGAQAGAHVCFAAGSREEVAAFHRAGLAGGGSDNGEPGYRLDYDPDYYGAFLIDPDGNHLGAVARLRPDTSSMPRARVIDHLSIGVADFTGLARYYDALFATLNVQRLYASPDFIIYGRNLNDTTFMLLHRPDAAGPQPGFHACFSARSSDEVRMFHTAGVAAGGSDNGAPGPRPEYSRDYYGAFVIDPEGNHLGVVAKAMPELG